MRLMNNLYGVVAGASALLFSATAPAMVVDLQEWTSNTDGAVTDVLSSNGMTSGLSSLPGGTFDGTGLGSVTYTVSGTGNHFVGLFLDPELNQAINGFTNEFGSTNGAAAAGQTWQIDDPIAGSIFANISGSNGALSLLNNTNSVGIGSVNGLACCDVSMALGYNFALAAGQTATVTFTLGSTAPGGGFYLQQTDGLDANGAPSADNVYYSSALSISGGGGPPVPEPATMALLGIGLFGVAFGRRRASA